MISIYLEEKREELVISFGEPGEKRVVATDLWSSYIAADSKGERLVFFTTSMGNPPQLLEVEGEGVNALPFVLPWKSSEEMIASGQMGRPRTYQVAWHPDGNQIAFYNNTGFYLADLSTGQLQEVDLEPIVEGRVETWLRWALHAQWSRT